MRSSCGKRLFGLGSRGLLSRGYDHFGTKECSALNSIDRAEASVLGIMFKAFGSGHRAASEIILTFAPGRTFDPSQMTSPLSPRIPLERSFCSSLVQQTRCCAVRWPGRFRETHFRDGVCDVVKLALAR